MCLVLLSYRAHPDMEVLLAGNRDEFLSRPSAPPAIIHRGPTVHAGKDLEAGGTWMGRGQTGMLAALTNRYAPAIGEPPDVLSRGGIVLDLLCRDSPQVAAEWLERLPVHRYRPFNVLFGDARGFYFFASQEGPQPRALAPGIYALSNSTLDDASWPKVARSLRFLEENRESPGERLLEGLKIFLADPTPPDALESASRAQEVHGALGAVFIRSTDYGTVSSTILTAGGVLGDRYYFAEGPALRESPASAFRLLQFDE